MGRNNVRRRRFIKTAGAGISATAVAGCRKQSPDKAQERGKVTGKGSDQPLSGLTINIGSLAPAPKTWHVGKGIEKGAQLAVEHINQDGGLPFDNAGVLGADVKLYKGNTNLSPATGREEFYRLVRKKNCHVTMGHFFPKVALQMFKPMSQTETIHISTGNPGPKMAELVHQRYEDFKYHFRTGPINGYDLAINELNMVKRWKEIAGWDKVAVLIENIGAMDPFAEYLDGRIQNIKGLDVPIFKRTSSGQSNWNPIWDELEENNVDLALSNLVLTGTPAVKQWADQKRQFEFGGIHVPAQATDYWKQTNGRCEYVFTMNAFTPQTKITAYTEDFTKQYMNRFKLANGDPLAPIWTSGLTYDAVNIYLTALADAVREEGLNTIPDSDTMVHYLEQVRWPKSTIFAGGDFKFRDKSYPHRAHDPAWSSWDINGVPAYQQWQKRDADNDPLVSGPATMECFAPRMSASSDYAVPHWIDKEVNMWDVSGDSYTTDPHVGHDKEPLSPGDLPDSIADSLNESGHFYTKNDI